MHVGMGIIFQNLNEPIPDHDVYQNELRLGDLAEPLGFDSIWGAEHHVTDYTVCPDVFQYLTYFAGRTEKIALGSAVVVLPWHDPLRVAEQISMLDTLSRGRVIVGIGRGLGRVEFDAFRADMNDSREYFLESAKMLIEGLEKGYCEFNGRLIRQPRADIRPRPHKSFKGRIYAAAVSPESARHMAELGVGILIIPQKPWQQVVLEVNEYRIVYRAVNGVEAPAPIRAGWVFCDEDAGRAEEGARKWIGAYWGSVVKHYELNAGHLGKLKGYASYKTLQDSVSTEQGLKDTIDFFLSLQIWGTPAQCYEKILETSKLIGADKFFGVFCYGGMPYDEAERNLRLFARAVMPELKKSPRLASATASASALRTGRHGYFPETPVP
jgi:alkanesulfonate monooxygenase SsuD/methylene tetrahydromethanopterin reductase-like flavin-dependent oxidoreductase (luciferase family)